MTYGTHMINLEAICTEVWVQKDVVTKRNLLLRAVATFKYKAKEAIFKDQIAKADANECDKIASNLILNKTDKVVNLLPR